MNNRKSSDLAFSIFLGMSIICIQCAPVKKNLIPKDTGATIFFDDFSGNTLDRSKWNVQVTGFHVNNEQQAYVDSANTVYIAHGADAEGAENGALVRQPRCAAGLVNAAGKDVELPSGRVVSSSTRELRYGSWC